MKQIPNEFSHILVSIEFFNNAIENYEKQKKSLDVDDFDGFNLFSGKIHTLEKLAACSKYVNLDFNIEERVQELTDDHDLNGWEQNGARHAYEQILKEIL